MKTVLVIDGQGGGCGKALIERLRQRLPEGCRVLAVGTNSMATSAMLRAGAAAGATGENAVILNAAQADVIAGPIGIVLANSLMGEVSPAIAAAVASSAARRVLIPMSNCSTFVAGVGDYPLGRYIDDAAEQVFRCLV